MASWHPPKSAGFGHGTWIGCPRLSLGSEACVYGWPSTGGRLTISNVSAFELDILEVDRFSFSEAAEDPTSEDAFCLQMRRLGCTFIQWRRAIYIDPSRRAEQIHTILGWPEKGGVWVIRDNEDALYDRDAGRIKLAKTMEERCWTIAMCGGTFYPDPADCEITRDLVEVPKPVELALRMKDTTVEGSSVR